MHDAFEASSQTVPFEEEMTRAKVWTDLLFDVVPANRLRQAFRLAFKTHKSSFAINAYDIKAAWEQILENESKDQQVVTQSDRDANPVQYCRAKADHFDEDGNIEVLLGGPGGKTVLVPCDICRTGAHQQRYAELLAEYRAVIGEMKSVKNVVLGMFDQVDRRKYRFMSAVEIIDAAREDLGKAIIDCKDDVKRGQMQVAWQRMLRMREHVEEASKVEGIAGPSRT